jgi:hypothetical protein
VGRTVIVGDVHGCADELDELLGAVALGHGDALVFVGDLVARGPDSRRVLRRYRELGARGALGNHEARILAVREAEQRGEPGPRLGPSHRQLMLEMDEADWGVLSDLRLTLVLPEHDVLVVHAGLVPGLPLEAQDRWALLHMRSLDDHGKPTDRPGPRSWAADYRGDAHAVFGHDARRGLQIHESATGLDSGCVYGGQLSALVLDAGARVPPPAERRDVIVQVDARAAYFGG